LLPAEECFWLTNADVELAIIIVVAYDRAVVADVEKLFVGCEDFAAIGRNMLAARLKLVLPRRLYTGPCRQQGGFMCGYQWPGPGSPLPGDQPYAAIS